MDGVRWIIEVKKIQKPITIEIREIFKNANQKDKTGNVGMVLGKVSEPLDAIKVNGTWYTPAIYPEGKKKEISVDDLDKYWNAAE